MHAVDPAKLGAISHAIEQLGMAERALVPTLRDGAIDAAALPAAYDAIERAFTAVGDSPITPWSLYLPEHGPKPAGNVFMAQRMLERGRPDEAIGHLARAVAEVRHATAGARQALEGARQPIATIDDLVARLDWVPGNPELSATTTRLAWDDLPIEVKAAVVRDGGLRVDLRLALRDLEKGNAFETAYGRLDYKDFSAASGIDALVARLRLDQVDSGTRLDELGERYAAGRQLSRREAFEVQFALEEHGRGALRDASLDTQRVAVASDILVQSRRALSGAWKEIGVERQQRLIVDPAAREVFESILRNIAQQSPDRPTQAQFDNHLRQAVELLATGRIPDTSELVARLQVHAAAAVGGEGRAAHVDTLHAWSMLGGVRHDLATLPRVERATTLAGVVAAHGAVPTPDDSWFLGLRDALASIRELAGSYASSSDEASRTIAAHVDELAERNVGRLEGTLRDGYGRHPEYAELGRIEQSLALLAGLEPATETATVRAANTLAW